MIAFVNIDKRERDTLHKICLEHNISVSFYTVEHNDLLVCAAIDCPAADIFFVLGRVFQDEIEKQIRKQFINH